MDVTGFVRTTVRGADDREDDVEADDELLVRAVERDRALMPFGARDCLDLPRGVAVPSDESEELDEWFTTDCRKFDDDCWPPHGVDGVTVCVEVVDREDDDEADGAGECERGVGACEEAGEDEGEPSLLETKASAFWAFNRDFRNSRLGSDSSLSNCRNSLA